MPCSAAVSADRLVEAERVGVEREGLIDGEKFDRQLFEEAQRFHTEAGRLPEGELPYKSD